MSEETDTEKKLSCVKETAVDTLNVRKRNIMTLRMRKQALCHNIYKRVFVLLQFVNVI